MFIVSEITPTKKTSYILLRCFILIVFLLGIQSLVKLQAQSYCSPVQSHGSGFYTTIHKVVQSGDNYIITLRVMHDGCSDPDCKPLNQYSVQAEAGSYSDVYYEEISGDVSLNGINLGPQIAGWSYTGFRISSINGIGAGNAGVFYITYTLKELQDQICMAKAGSWELEVQFYESDF